MPKHVQIPLEAFLRLVQYFYVENHSEDLYKAIQSDTELKLDSIVKHELYTQSKIAETEEERENARKQYLDKIGMRESFRW